MSAEGCAMPGQTRGCGSVLNQGRKASGATMITYFEQPLCTETTTAGLLLMNLDKVTRIHKPFYVLYIHIMIN